MATRIIVVVGDGLVSGVYASIPEADVDVIDLDTTDVDAEAAVKERYAALEADVTARRIYLVS